MEDIEDTEARPDPVMELPPLRTRGSLAVRIVALVLLVVVGNGASAIAIVDQLQGLGASFDLLTAVYIPFQENLARARAQSGRIHKEIDRAVRTAGDPEGVELSRGDLLNFREALEVRVDDLRAVRLPLDQALTYSGRVGGAARLDPVRGLIAQVEELEALVELDAEAETRAVLVDVSHQAEINRLFSELDRRGRDALDEQRVAVSQARREAEQFTMLVSIGAALLSLIATLAVILTLRSLRRLTQSVRGLGAGDWSQRIEVSPHPQRDDEVSRLAREVNLMASALEERERRLLHQERLAAVGRMASQITHEIRNPLSSLALNVELLEDEIEEAGPEADQLLSRITAEVDRLTSITEAYLDFSRNPEPELARVDLREELRDLLEFMAGEHEQAGICVEQALDTQTTPWVQADANRLRQAFLNLLRNAREAALELPDALDPECAQSANSALREGDRDLRAREPTIRVELSCKAGKVCVVVGDSGRGIRLPPDQRERIFEAFFTDKAHGTGLGLPVVQQIALDHGGQVRLLETGPHGTRFELCLPACDPLVPSVSSENL